MRRPLSSSMDCPEAPSSGLCSPSREPKQPKQGFDVSPKLSANSARDGPSACWREERAMLFLTYSSRCLPTLPVGPLAQLCTILQPVTVPPQIVGQHLMPGKTKPCMVGAGACPPPQPLRPPPQHVPTPPTLPPPPEPSPPPH